MQRPSSTGLATAFFRLYLLEALAPAPARANALLVRIAAERLPFATGAFSRAMQSLLEGGYIQPAPHGAVSLTPLGAAERLAERERWRTVLPAVARLVGDTAPRPEPTVVEPPAPRRVSDVADEYLDKVLVASIRDRIVAARESARSFVVALGVIDLEHASLAHQRAILHRAIRATLGGATSLFGGDIDAFRFGEAGVALLAPAANASRGDELAAVLRARLDELVRTAVTTVRAFGGARWSVRAGSATWTADVVTSAALLRTAQDALAHDGQRTAA